MHRLQSILVGVDFTPCSATALRQAIRIAKWNQADLRVVHVLESLVVTDMETALGKVQPDVRGNLIRGVQHNWEQFASSIDGADQLEFIVEVDHPVSAMLRLVDQHASDLLVLGTHGVSPAERGAGTTAAACIRKAQTLVLLVEEPHHGPFESVVACIDFSDTSRKALEQAIRVAIQDQSTLHILHVFDAPWHHLHYRAETSESSPDFQKQYTDALQQQLMLFAQPLKDEMKSIKTEYHVRDANSHGGGIVDFALEGDVDLVVLGTRGRTNLRDLIMGSTAERVVRDTPCSILTVKPD